MQELAEQSKELMQQQLQAQLEANQAKRAQVRCEASGCSWHKLSLLPPRLCAPELSSLKPGPPVPQVKMVFAWQCSRQPSQIMADCTQSSKFCIVLQQQCLQPPWQPISKLARPTVVSNIMQSLVLLS